MPSSSRGAGFSSRGLISTKLDIVSSRGGAGTRGAYPCPDGTRIERRAGMAFSVPDLTYAFDALEPHIDAKTMEIHHDRHHKTYVTNLNTALKPHTDLHKKTLVDLIRGVKEFPADVQMAVRNNGGGHLNHSMFWMMMAKNG